MNHCLKVLPRGTSYYNIIGAIPEIFINYSQKKVRLTWALACRTLLD